MGSLKLLLGPKVGGVPVTPDELTIEGTPDQFVESGDSYNFIPTVGGGQSPYTFTLDGTLPPSLSFNSSTGAITGTLD